MEKRLQITWRGIGEFAGLVAIITLVVTILQLTQSNQASDDQDAVQATQFFLLQQQLDVQREMATLQAQVSGSGPTATAISQHLAELNSTAVALVTQEAHVKQILTLLSEDFENGVAGKYSNDGGDWTVINDGVGNHVLRADSMGQSWSYYRLGLPDFTDGVIEYRVRFMDFDATSGSGNAFVIFRESPDDARYQFVIEAAGKRAIIYFQGASTSDRWIPLEGTNPMYSYDFQKGVWYSVRIECHGNILQAYIDSNLVIAVEDTKVRNGRFSLAIGPNTIAQYDDIRISRLGP